MTNLAISVENLGKRYRVAIPHATDQTLGQKMGRVFRAPLRPFRRLMRPESDEDTIWALKHISFEVKQGEVIGIIGANGAGKSTLLKILSRITEQTEGRVRLRGRAGSLLEVGTGFHGELTGRENIFLSGTILGMTRSEVIRRFDEIVEFSGIGRFIDTPVKRYSSGMAVRLAFSVAAHLDTNVLFIDEVLSVGDARFQKQCMGKMQASAESGKTVLLVSHNMASIRMLSSRAMWLDQGRLKFDGPTPDVIGQYLGRADSDQPSGFFELRPGTVTRPKKGLPQDVEIRFVKTVNRCGEQAYHFVTGEPMVIEIGIFAKRQCRYLEMLVKIYNADDQLLATIVNEPDGSLLKAGPHSLLITLPELRLLEGQYSASVYVLADSVGQDMILPVIRFEVLTDVERRGSIRYARDHMGFFDLEASWTLRSSEPTSDPALI